MNYLIKNIIFSVLLVAIMELFLATDIPDFFIWVLFLAASFLISLSAGGQSFTLARLPFLFFVGCFLFFYLMFGEITGRGFLFIVGSAFFLILCFNNYFSSLFKILPNIIQEESENFVKKYELARNLILAFLFLTAFVWYADAFIVYSVLGLPFFLALLMIFFSTLFLSSYVFRIYSFTDKNELSQDFLLYSWILGLAISQISWIVGFWPFGYLTAALVITIIYYTVIAILKEYLFGELQKKQAVGELIFAALILVIIFYFTKWLPV